MDAAMVEVNMDQAEAMAALDHMADTGVPPDPTRSANQLCTTETTGSTPQAVPTTTSTRDISLDTARPRAKTELSQDLLASKPESSSQGPATIVTKESSATGTLSAEATAVRRAIKRLEEVEVETV